MEARLVEHIKKKCDRFYGVTSAELRQLATDLAKSNNIPIKSTLGPKWLNSFLSRHNLVKRVSQSISIDRARGVSKSALTIFYDLLEDALKCVKSSDRIYNVDETGVSTVSKPRSKVICIKGAKRVQAISSAERGSLTTVILGMNPAGHFIPPLVVYPNKKVPIDVAVPRGTKFCWSGTKKGFYYFIYVFISN